jgi:hypothetical protein
LSYRDKPNNLGPLCAMRCGSLRRYNDEPAGWTVEILQILVAVRAKPSLLRLVCCSSSSAAVSNALSSAAARGKMVSSNPLIFSLLKIRICCAAHRHRARSDPEIDWLRRFSRTTSTFSTRRQSSRSSSTRRSASSSPPTHSSWYLFLSLIFSRICGGCKLGRFPFTFSLPPVC